MAHSDEQKSDEFPAGVIVDVARAGQRLRSILRFFPFVPRLWDVKLAAFLDELARLFFHSFFERGFFADWPFGGTPCV